MVNPNLRAIFTTGSAVPLSAEEAFTNRTTELEAFRQSLTMFEDWAARTDPSPVVDVTQARTNVLVYYGIGGIGKTALSKHLEDLTDLTAIDEKSSVYEASVRFTSRGRDGRGHIRTSWDVAEAEKHTAIAFEAGITVVLNHQEASGVAKDARGATIERFQFDQSIPRLVSHYVDLYESVLFDAEPYGFGVEENKLLYRLLLGALR